MRMSHAPAMRKARSSINAMNKHAGARILHMEIIQWQNINGLR